MANENNTSTDPEASLSSDNTDVNTNQSNGVNEGDVNSGSTDGLQSDGDDDALSPTENDTLVILSELLTFVHFYMQSCNIENIKRTVLCSFSGEKIVEAKVALWESAVKSKLKKFQNRKKSTTRSESEANICDIIEGLQDLDRQQCKVIFAAVNLGLIPRHSPENLNEMAMLDRIVNLEKLMENIQIKMDRNCSAITSQDERIEKLEEDSASHEALIHELGANVSSNGTKTDKVDSPSGTCTSSSTVISTPDANASEGAVAVTTSEATTDTGSTDGSPPSGVKSRTDVMNSVVTPKRGGDKAVQTDMDRPRPLDAGRQESTQVDEGPTAGPQPARMSFAQVASRQSHASQSSQRQLGDSRSSSFASDDEFVTPRYHRRNSRQANRGSRHLFITKVDRDYSCEQLYSYLLKCGVQPKGLFLRSHPNSSYKSFVTTVQDTDFAKVCNRRLWSEGVEIREYKMRD